MSWTNMLAVVVAIICVTLIVILPTVRAIKKSERINLMKEQTKQLEEVKDKICCSHDNESGVPKDSSKENKG